MGKLVNIPLDKKLFKNVDGAMLTNMYGALENCFVTEAKGLSKFPGLKLFCDLGGDNNIHINRHGNDMIAVGSDGRTFKVDRDGNFKAITGSPVLGGGRVSFARTRDGLFMAAGKQIIKYDGVKNTILSKDAPDTYFVGHLDGYLLAVEKNSGRFQHSNLNDFYSWDALDTFAVDGSPDNIGSMLVTPFGEIVFGGEESVEQYERLAGGSAPFFKRWSAGYGISEPDTLCFADNSVWGLNSENEFSVLSGQTMQATANDVQDYVEKAYGLDDLGGLNNAWAYPCFVKGNKFIIFQSPDAINSHGTKGITLALDIRRGGWFELYGWNTKHGVPAIWPGKSIFKLWGKTFVGGQGKIYELDSDTYTNSGKPQRAFVRTAHFDDLGTMRVNKVRMTLKRGVGSYTENPKIMFRSNLDNKGFGLLQYRDLGNTGDGDLIIEFGAQGLADTWQFEWSVTDDCQFEVRKLQLEIDKVNR